MQERAVGPAPCSLFPAPSFFDHEAHESHEEEEKASLHDNLALKISPCSGMPAGASPYRAAAGSDDHRFLLEGIARHLQQLGRLTLVALHLFEHRFDVERHHFIQGKKAAV